MNIMHVAEEHPIEAVMIGASTGGVAALLALLSGLPSNFRLPIVAVLHLPEHRDSLLAEIFQHKLPTRKASHRPRCISQVRATTCPWKWTGLFH
jgi:two-component system chemotaxis response regulator CheB